MGWCSGTELFDKVARVILNASGSDDEKCEQIKNVIGAFEYHDWDCQEESRYVRAHPLVKAVMREMHPDWYEDEDE